MLIDSLVRHLKQNSVVMVYLIILVKICNVESLKSSILLYRVGGNYITFKVMK